MNKLTTIMADIVGTFNHIAEHGKDREYCSREMMRVSKRVGSELKLKRDMFACHNLITAMRCDVNNKKTCLAYQYKGKLYSTARNVPGMDSTEYLHSLSLKSAEWDNMPKFSVWIASGNVYDKFEL
jgi:hypothetical protein